ncbi:hypothetical protein M405DRAFT_835683 [Rhizopogon salebrosus TDB-379]|nr:hypothetical protein M405DRAFT_835683 [Rhizopogon salebrosus TDB-379]
MHWGEDQPERGAAVPANAPFIGEDLNEDINMHSGEHRFDIHDRIVTHATEVVDSSDWQEIIPIDYTEIENVGADGGQLETESLPSAEQSDSQDQMAVLLAKARHTLDMAVDLLTTMPETTVSTKVRRERARLLDVLSTFDRYMD